MEMARVVRPGGSVLLLEHSRSDIGALGAYQDVTAGAVAATGKGCQWNQDVLRMVRKAGLKIVRERRELLGTIVVVEAKRKP